MSTVEPLAALEAIIWDLCPALRNVRVIIQDLDQPHVPATAVMFHREPVVSLEGMPTRPVEVKFTASLPLARVPRLTPADMEMLLLVEAEPGLKGDVIARRIGVVEVTARRRLGRLVKGGWLASSHSNGYSVTDAGKEAIEKYQA